LEHKDLVKTVIGSVAAAFSGISKPFFGYFIITVGVTYYKEDANRRVGWFSIMFALIGLLSLFTHTLQHYFFGAVGEKAMANLRQALYSGISYVNQYLHHHLHIFVIYPRITINQSLFLIKP